MAIANNHDSSVLWLGTERFSDLTSCANLRRLQLKDHRKELGWEDLTEQIRRR